MKSVDTYIESNPEWAVELKLIRNLLCDLPFEEHIKWNAPVYSAYGRNLVGFSAFKHHLGIWFFEGVLLNDPKEVLENAQRGKTKYMRQWKYFRGDALDLASIRQYLEETLKLAKTNPAPSKEKSQTTPSEPLPQFLAEALEKDSGLRQAYERFTPYKQREFAEYISEAKRETTKRARLEKIRNLILNGEGLNDRYR